MVVLWSLWTTTQCRPNTLEGSSPAWEVKEVITELPKSDIEAARSIEAMVSPSPSSVTLLAARVSAA